MISCVEFIPAYSELFKYLDNRFGYEEVEKFWACLSDAYLPPLCELAQTKGLEGCFEYWVTALTEEAADFRATIDENKQEVVIEMRRCPSMARLINEKHIKPYENYCKHCPALYDRALKPLGFRYHNDLSRCHEAKCCIRITKTTKNDDASD